MKKLEKDFLLAWVMGMLLPSLILWICVGFVRPETDGETVPSTTGISFSALAPQMMIPVMDGSGRVTSMELETYLCGVVLAEMPAEFELEALKAQSVVARTYALRRLEQGTKHPQGAVCMEASCCQGFIMAEDYIDLGGELSGVSKVTSAVMATAGQVLTYRKELIDATYFSCSGGTTEDALAVWGNDVPYLQSTVSPGEERSRFYSDTMSFTPRQLEDRLGIGLIGEPEEWFAVLSYTNGGGVDRIDICGTDFSGVEVRQRLGLRSTDFTVIASVEEIIFETRGYGHRVGMSQYGADAMAVAGSTYDRILAHYYRGTDLVQYDDGN